MSRRTLIILPRAASDVEDYSDYLMAEAGPGVAIRFESRVAGTIAELPRFPRRGPAHGLPAGIRFVRVEGFPKLLVFYRVTPRAVVVVRVLHAARDIGVEDLL